MEMLLCCGGRPPLPDRSCSFLLLRRRLQQHEPVAGTQRGRSDFVHWMRSRRRGEDGRQEVSIGHTRPPTTTAQQTTRQRDNATSDDADEAAGDSAAGGKPPDLHRPPRGKGR